MVRLRVAGTYINILTTAEVLSILAMEVEFRQTSPAGRLEFTKKGTSAEGANFSRISLAYSSVDGHPKLAVRPIPIYIPCSVF
jgi:hypothetical protein